MSPMDYSYDFSTTMARRGLHWVKFNWQGKLVRAVIVPFDSDVLLPDKQVQAKGGDYVVMSKPSDIRIVDGRRFRDEAEAVD